MWYDKLKPRWLRRWFTFHSFNYKTETKKQRRRFRLSVEVGQSGRSVCCVDNGFDVTATVLGDRRHSNAVVTRLTSEHMRRTRCKDEHYAVNVYKSKAEMRRQMMRRMYVKDWTYFKVVWI